MKSFAAYVADVVRSEEPFRSEALFKPEAPELPDSYVVLPTATQSGCRVSADVWAWPEELMPHWIPSKRTIDFRLPHDLRAIGGDALLDTIKRLILLMMVHPLADRKRLASLQKAQRMLNEFAFAILSTGKHTSFGSLDPGTYHSIFRGSAKGRKNYDLYLQAYLDDLRRYGDLGLIADFPGADPRPAYPAASDEVAPDLVDEEGEDPAAYEDDDEDPHTWIPFPDAYVSEMGRRCHFYLDELGPNLARLFGDHPDMPENRERWWPKGRRGAPKEGTIKATRIDAWRDYLTRFEWRHTDGRPMTDVPFGCKHLVFPPTKYEELLRLVGRHMDALVHILLLLSGGRKSEIQSLSRNDVDRPSILGDEDDGFALVEGRTFKPSPAEGGTARNWPIPRDVSRWLANQRILAEQMGPQDGRSLWFSMSTTHPGVERIDFHHRCTTFAKRHDLDHLTAGPAHPHRFRKTIARLALLALTGAPTLVMVMFGHQDMAATLNYLLADPCIRDDLRTMLGEHRVEIGMNIMQDLDHASGPAADVLRSARDKYFDQLYVPPNERAQRTRLLQFVTARLAQGGYDIKVVYPGIICIRALEQKGLCTTPGREINPSACQSNCRHRLELSLRRDEVCAIIEDLLEEYEGLGDAAAKHELVRSWLKSQLIDNVGIFPDIKERYSADDRYRRVVSEHHR